MHRLSKKQSKQIAQQLAQLLGFELEPQAYLKFQDREFYIWNGIPAITSYDDQLFLTLKGALALVHKLSKGTILVDQGAIPHLIKGADLMRPGIVSADPNIKQGDLVVILDQVHRKPIAIGRALVDGNQLMGPKGKVVQNLHYIGDKLWKLSSELT